MEVYRYNHVFDHVETMLREYVGSNPAYNQTVFVLGYNVLKDLTEVRQKYPGYRIIIYQLEQLFEGSHWVNRHSYEMLKQAHEIWDYDYANIQWMRQNYRLDAKFVPMLYTKSLQVIPPNPNPDIDILFYGYLHERRAKLVFYLQQKLAGRYKLFDLYGVWGQELDSYIARSKIILNVHGSETAKQEQVRMFYPVLNSRCVVSEKSEYNYLGNSIVELPYDRIGDGVISLLGSGKWQDYTRTAATNYKQISDRYLSKIQF